MNDIVVDFRMKGEEKQKLRNIARYYNMTMTALIKKWIKHNGPEGFREELKTKFA